jgi:ligand-binding SRPBCC domain-containing protein
MKIYEYRSEQSVPRPLDEVFAFFSDARNLEAITPPWLSFEILTPQPIPMQPGTLIDYRLRWHGVPLRWRTEITRWEPPLVFADEQLRGPYALWRHTHRFEALGNGTRILDHVQYALPLGPLGQLAHAVSVRANIGQIFEYRRDRIRQRFGDPADD